MQLRLLLMYPGAAMYVSTTRCTIEKKKKKVAGWERRAATWYTYLRTDRGPVGKWKKRIGKIENDNCAKCGIQETGWHLMFGCPVNTEEREAKIKGARIWEDLENKAMIRKGE